MNNKIINKLCRVIMVILGVLIIFFTTDFILSEIADKRAYEDAVGDDIKWLEITEKIQKAMKDL